MDDIAEDKAIVGGRALLAAPINGINPKKCSESEIDRQVKGIVQNGAPGDTFIFGTLVMPYPIPE
ncbi:MAG: hypothetical protein GY866_22185 [Proteobacteria bacterium]|nr:hypothetical protein [Pseudomonadota bacterium]